ncbi:D-ribitol-5-phosphate cytidylyltransferase isoform X5 [Mastacembelus armatus]|nr:D-ribitol-5-phosphate cytidylyltransferase isoform X5 [Mastacembelus armatus]
MDLMTDIIQRFQHRKVRAVPGGSTRHRSICSGVLALREKEQEGKERLALDRPKVVIIHDAVRPFVEEDFLYKIAMAAKEQGAAGAIRPLVSTVIATTSEGYLDHSLERAKYRASEMPQGFRYDVIYQAYQRCTESDFEFGTECLHLALQYCGTNAKLIEGPPTLWKVTYKRDLAAAESIIKETLSRSACIVTGGSAQAAALADALQKAVGALDMELDIIPELKGDNGRYLLKEWNFIQVSVSHPCLSGVDALLADLEAANRALLHPLVVIWKIFIKLIFKNHFRGTFVSWQFIQMLGPKWWSPCNYKGKTAAVTRNTSNNENHLLSDMSYTRHISVSIVCCDLVVFVVWKSNL